MWKAERIQQTTEGGIISKACEVRKRSLLSFLCNVLISYRENRFKKLGSIVSLKKKFTFNSSMKS